VLYWALTTALGLAWGGCWEAGNPFLVPFLEGGAEKEIFSESSTYLSGMERFPIIPASLRGSYFGFPLSQQPSGESADILPAGGSLGVPGGVLLKSWNPYGPLPVLPPHCSIGGCSVPSSKRQGNPHLSGIL
jgi:hypothetical protein